MDDAFWANLEAMRRRIEQITSGTNLATVATAMEAAHRFASTVDFDQMSSTLAEGEYAVRHYERLSTNSALVARAIDDMIARSGSLPDLASPVFANLRIEPPTIAFNVAQVPLLSTHINELAQMNHAVSGAMSSIAWGSLPKMDESLGRRLLSLSDSYRDLFAGLPRIGSPLPRFVTELPARDLVVKSTIVSSRTADFEPADAKIDLDDPAYARADVDLMLAELNPDYVTVLDEAFEALAGKSLGRVRHALVSLRELITHVLHDLSPDAELIAWSTDPKHFDKGKPTRAGRYLYICRFVTYGAYGDYLKKSSKMTSAFFELMNVLHNVRPEVGDFQLRLMLTDAIGTLRFLLRTARYRP